MIARHSARARLLLLGAFALACTRDGRDLAVAPPSFSLAGDPVVTSLVFGPDGSTVCNFLPEGAVVLGRLINPNPPSVVGADGFACPDNTLAMEGPPGSWLMRVQLPADPAIGSLPWRHLETDPIVFGDDVRRDVQIQNGIALAGSATLDGSPLEGVDLNFVYDAAPVFGATFGASGPDGAWTEFFRPQFILQNNVRYQAGCGALGVKFLEGPPPGGFVFPSDVSAINCTMVTAPSAQFSHTLTRLVVTPMPGDIGGQSVELADEFGIGWGVQFPVGPDQSPVHVPPSATHLFGGGLLIGIAPDRILSGISLEGQLQCGAACRDLGLDGTVRFTPQTDEGRRVTWRYSDATSPEGIGTQVTQRSLDGKPPHDYVLFRFSIQNGGSSARTFYVGAFMDWDVEEDASDDVGFTALAGRLMGVTSLGESGVHVGSLLVGAPVSGNLFYNFSGEVPIPSSTADQFQALSGGMRLTEIGAGDAHYIHGVGPVTLAPGKKAEIWLGIIAGENRQRFLANARVAAADIATRQDRGVEAADGPLTVSTTPRGVLVRAFSKTKRPQ